MSDTLARARTVRFGKRLDRSLGAEAARRKVTVSELLRRAAEAFVETGRQSAGDWCLAMAQRKSRGKQNSDLIAAYDRRHK